MSERELLEVIARDAPDLPSGYADEVISAVKRKRQRRWAVGLSCAAVLAIAAVPLSRIESGHSGSHHSPAALQTADVVSPPPAIPARARAYAAAITWAGSDHGQAWGRVYLPDTTCPTVAQAPCGAIPGGPAVPPALQSDILSALGDVPARFIHDSGAVTDRNLDIAGHGVVVTLGYAKLDGGHATVAIGTQCGGLCGAGLTLTLVVENNVWTVVDSQSSWTS